MALGAAGIFQDLHLPVFYVDTENAALLSLISPGKTSALPDLLKVETCLKCYGYQVLSTQPPTLQPQNRALYGTLIAGWHPLVKVFGRLILLAGKVRGQG